MLLVCAKWFLIAEAGLAVVCAILWLVGKPGRIAETFRFWFFGVPIMLLLLWALTLALFLCIRTRYRFTESGIRIENVFYPWNQVRRLEIAAMKGPSVRILFDDFERIVEIKLLSTLDGHGLPPLLVPPSMRG